MFRILRHYWPEIRRHFWWLLGCILSVVGVVALNACLPFAFRRLAEILSVAPTEASLRDIDLLIVGIGAIYLGIWSFWRIFELCVTFFECRGMRDLEIRCYSVIQRQSLQFFENSFSGSLLKKSHRFVKSFEVLVDWFFFSGLNTGLRMVVVFTVFAWYEPLLSLLFGCWIVVFIGVSCWLSLLKMRREKIEAAADSAVGAAYSDSIAGMATVKVFAREKEEDSRISTAAYDLYFKRKHVWLIGTAVDGIQGVLVYGLEFMLVVYMAYRWRQGDFGVSDFVFFQTYIFILVHQLWDFGRQLRHLFRATADASEMAEIFDSQVEVPDAPNAKVLVVRQGEIEFRNITFSYLRKNNQLEDFSLHIPTGQRVALVGHTGAGKSTIVKLLFRFYDVQSGAIMIDRQDIAGVTQTSLRRNISLVPQQPDLFHRSLRENIAFGKPNATDDEIREAARRAQILDFIESLPEGFETLVGERGVKLSGGEKQRVAIAQAFLENSPLLVLDEATSALDSLTEKRVQTAVFELLKKRTSIVIAHRLSTVLHMDRIIVLDAGRIIEDGSHAELLRQDGVYARMWKHQAGGFLET